MEARVLRGLGLLAILFSLGASHRTQNFIVEASSRELAVQVAEAAEKYRRELAIEWLGHELDPWRDICPITVESGPNQPAAGVTSFMFERQQPFGWTMKVQGTPERVLDSVLPHEITHTIFATHFGRPLPRWADEGACTTVEHSSEKGKQHRLLLEFLTTNRGIAFNRMFAMKEYPRDILPLYAQGYSLAKYLIAQGGKRRFISYIGEGMQTENWPAATRKHYSFRDLSELQVTWVNWVKKGSPIDLSDRPDLLARAARPPAAQSNSIAENSPRPRPEFSQVASDSSKIRNAIYEQPVDGKGPPTTFASDTKPKSAGSGSWYARQRDIAKNGTAPSQTAAQQPARPLTNQSYGVRTADSRFDSEVQPSDTVTSSPPLTLAPQVKSHVANVVSASNWRRAKNVTESDLINVSRPHPPGKPRQMILEPQRGGVTNPANKWR